MVVAMVTVIISTKKIATPTLLFIVRTVCMVVALMMGIRTTGTIVRTLLPNLAFSIANLKTLTTRISSIFSITRACAFFIAFVITVATIGTNMTQVVVIITTASVIIALKDTAISCPVAELGIDSVPGQSCKD